MKLIKKYILIILALILIIAGLLLYKKQIRPPEVKGKTLLMFVPARFEKEPLAAVLGINDLKQTYQLIEKTNLSKVFKESRLMSLVSNKKPHDKLLELIDKDSVVALYGNRYKDLKYLSISRLSADAVLINFINRYFSGNKLIEKYNDIEIYSIPEMGYYAILPGMIVSAGTKEIIKEVVDLKNNISKIKNFNAVYDWVENEMDLSAAGYLFTSNEQSYALINEMLDQFLYMNNILTGASLPAMYHEFRFKKGLYVKSYGKFKSGSEYDLAAASPKAIKFIPDKILLANINMGQNFRKFDEWSGKNEILDYINDELKNNILPYLGRETGYAIFGPSAQSMSLVMPNLVVYGEVKDSQSQEKIYSNIKNIINVDMKKISHFGMEYDYAEVPLFFGQKIVVCMIGLDVDGKSFLAITSSKDSVEDIIELYKGKELGFADSPAWREISLFIPEKFSGFSYADFNALSLTVGMYIAKMRRNEELEGFIKTAPLAWLGPSGSASLFMEDHIEVYSYFPVQDLSTGMWKKIIVALEELIF
jgi:hypothetical protein